MCGIAGIISSKLTKEKAFEVMEDMLLAQKHRGPDNTSIFQEKNCTLGHNRLSIIDLREEANQPMEYMGLVIVFNGEVYNYLEIKDELLQMGYNFTTSSDTEVVVAAYKAWGDKSVHKFVGMWSFAILDQHTGHLFFSRDRSGIKPFYYQYQNDELYFASEVKTLKQTPIFDSTLNLKQLSVFLQIGWFYNNDKNIFENVKILPPAHNATFKNGVFNVDRYWDLDSSKKNLDDFEFKKEQFLTFFNQSIKQHNRSDVEVGMCLSGGMDSSAIASIHANQFNTPIKSFTIFYEGKDTVDERPWVSEVIAKYPNIDPYYYSPSDDELKKEFDNFIHHFDFPPSGSSPFSQYFVMKLAASKGMKVVLDGQGSDEILAGYMHSFYRFIGQDIKELKWRSAWSKFKNHTQLQEFNWAKKIDVLAKSILSAIYNENKLFQIEYENKYPFLFDEKEKFNLRDVGNSGLDKFLYQLVYTSSLPNLLHNEDRNSMAFSIESRVPFLDHRLVEFAAKLTDEDKINKGKTKYILRESLKKYFPQKIYNRFDKKGFVTPGEVKWLRGSLSFLLDSDFKNLSFLNQNKLQKVISEYKNGENKNAKFVWRIAVLNYWLDKNK